MAFCHRSRQLLRSTSSHSPSDKATRAVPTHNNAVVGRYLLRQISIGITIGDTGLTRALMHMDAHTTASPLRPQLVDITALRTSGIFPIGREPSIRTLREWTRLRLIPHHRLGHFVYYDLDEVSVHIRTKLKVPAR